MGAIGIAPARPSDGFPSATGRKIDDSAKSFNNLAAGTYELLGPKVQGNVERLERLVL
jgi:hypothetical protein